MFVVVCKFRKREVPSSSISGFGKGAEPVDLDAVVAAKTVCRRRQAESTVGGGGKNGPTKVGTPNLDRLAYSVVLVQNSQNN